MLGKQKKKMLKKDTKVSQNRWIPKQTANISKALPWVRLTNILNTFFKTEHLLAKTRALTRLKNKKCLLSVLREQAANLWRKTRHKREESKIMSFQHSLGRHRT